MKYEKHLREKKNIRKLCNIFCLTKTQTFLIENIKNE